MGHYDSFFEEEERIRNTDRLSTLRRVSIFDISMGMFTHSFPTSGIPLAAGWVKGKPAMWVEYEMREGGTPTEEPRTFFCCKDGEEIPNGMEYIDSLYSFDGGQMLHLYGDTQ